MTSEDLAAAVRGGLLWTEGTKRYGPMPVGTAECPESRGVYAVMPFQDRDSQTGELDGPPSVLVYAAGEDDDEIESLVLDRPAVEEVVRQALTLWPDLLAGLDPGHAVG